MAAPAPAHAPAPAPHLPSPVVFGLPNFHAAAHERQCRSYLLQKRAVDGPDIPRHADSGGSGPRSYTVNYPSDGESVERLWAALWTTPPVHHVIPVPPRTKRPLVGDSFPPALRKRKAITSLDISVG
ncbi:hypothetical protein C8R47DRAFT_1213980 [Mycena vitilis]|nr:hypothetical protein C8R47DRAFT_1213980 [Mycena vitilis]